MITQKHQTHAKKAVRAKMRGRKRVASRYVPRYPITAERELRRVNRAYVRIFRKPVNKRFNAVMKAYRREARKDSREDGLFDFIAFVHEIVIDIAAEISLAIEEFNMRQRVEKIARMVQGRTAAEWIASVKSTLGIDLTPSYYEGDTYEQIIQQWIARNLSYLQGLPMESLLTMETIIGNAYRDGVDADVLESQLQRQLDAAARRADWAARDQVSSLNASLMEMQQKSLGVRFYKWKSAGDGDVRDCHQEFDGHIYSWDDPPDDWYYTKSRGIVYTGQNYNPGEAPGCRCCAVPLFEAEAFRKYT